MSEKTNIEWCDSTLNFWSGCTKVSPGCAHCYAETLSNRGMGNIAKWGNGQPRRLHESAFKMADRLNKKARICDNCGHAQQSDQGNPNISSTCCLGCYQHNVSFHGRRIFSLSIGDIGDSEVPMEWFNRVMVKIDECRNVTWILCTKRCDEFLSRWLKCCEHWGRTDNRLPANIIMLTSVENQEMANLRIPQLLRIPAARRGLSLEPLLGPVDLKDITDKDRFPGAASFDVLNGMMIHHDDDMRWTPDEKLDWIIIGGESGRNARPCDLDWIRSLVSEGKAAGVATFVKQLGANPIDDCSTHTSDWTEKPHRPEPLRLNHKKGADIYEWPEAMRLQQFPTLIS